jgi:hypothetical protein
VIKLARYTLAVVFVLVGAVYFIAASFIREWDNLLYKVPHDMRNLWGWLIAGWILIQIAIVRIDYGYRYGYKFALQFLSVLILIVLNSTAIKIAYFHDQGILGIVPFHDSYAGVLYAIFMMLIAAFLMKAWFKKSKR